MLLHGIGYAFGRYNVQSTSTVVYASRPTAEGGYSASSVSSGSYRSQVVDNSLPHIRLPDGRIAYIAPDYRKPKVGAPLPPGWRRAMNPANCRDGYTRDVLVPGTNRLLRTEWSYTRPL